MALPRDENADPPQVGRSPRNLSFHRLAGQLSMLVAAEAGMVPPSGPYPDNPASADAIRAADVRPRSAPNAGNALGRRAPAKAVGEDGRDPGVTRYDVETPALRLARTGARCCRACHGGHPAQRLRQHL